jgi:hypothetical protein
MATFGRAIAGQFQSSLLSSIGQTVIAITSAFVTYRPNNGIV